MKCVALAILFQTVILECTMMRLRYPDYRPPTITQISGTLIFIAFLVSLAT